jgi:hypothetical protein
MEWMSGNYSVKVVVIDDEEGLRDGAGVACPACDELTNLLAATPDT